MSSSDSEYESANEDLPEDSNATNKEEEDTTEHIKKSLEDAEELKQEGNDHFRAKKWNEALVAYQTAIGRLPKRKNPRDVKGKGKQRDVDDEGPDNEAPPSSEASASATPAVVSNSPLALECAKARSVLYANLGACFVKLDDHKAAVEACTEALKDDPKYIKALQRRAASNEKIDSWSSLSSAQEDYNLLLTLLPSAFPQVTETKRALQLLKPRIEAAQKHETGEMLNQLKGLGNNILGNFGLSTDNFQFTPNGQGGYSMNFSR